MPELKLARATLPLVSKSVHTPAYVPTSAQPGVVHLGLGAFHRAHQAMVFDQLLREGDMRWGIHGVGMTQAGLVNKLRAQDGLYAVRVAGANGIEWHVPGALWQTSVATTERQNVLNAIAAPSTRWITLTVTEKGYTPVLAQLLIDGLRLRHAAGLAGLTIASCDNLQGNGHKLKAIIHATASSQDAELMTWIDARCAFPCSMVDRIVPAATEAVASAAKEALGMQDECALSTETFWEWVIEDNFVDPSDAALLSRCGVRVTSQVHSYEEAKLRMLNGSHSAMALMGAITGRAHIADCIGSDHIQEFVHRLMTQEVAPHLSRADWADYRDALIQRFGNPYLKHSVHQIATDSSQKIPQRWPPSVLGQMAKGQSFEHHALAAAIFLRYTLAKDEQGKAYALNDPQAESLMAIGANQASEPQACVRTLLAREDLWGKELAASEAWLERVRYWHDQVLHQGVDATVKYIIQQDFS
ncbi:MAG: Polyol:NADP oxidoreductase [Pseudomonadota bacterium]|jgi:fructuronate reductase